MEKTLDLISLKQIVTYVDGVFDVLKTLGITKSDLLEGSQLSKDLADV